MFALAAALRLQGVDWDQGQHLHPDERFLTMVETAIAPPHSIAEYFDTARSPLNPSNHRYRFFVYGTLPLFLVRLVAGWLGLADYGHVHFVGRMVSALFDLGTVWLTIEIGTEIAGLRAGWMAGALMALSVTSIQNAHFFTVDSAGAFFATASLRALLAVAESGSVAAHVLLGALFGAMLGCRINLALLAAVYPLGMLHAWRVRRVPLVRLVAGAGATALTAALTFRLVQPYAFAGPGFFGLAIAPDFLSSMREIRGLATGEFDYPPGVQWIGRAPILFPGKNLLVWGLGPAWGVAAVAGIVWWLTARARSLEGRVWLEGTVLAWGLLLFAYHATQFVTTGRYFLPIVPVLAVFAVWPLAARPTPARSAVAAGLIALTAAWAVAFTAIYRRPISRVEASRWIYRNVPAGATIANEHWDDGLPLAVDDFPRGSYRGIELHLYDEDTPSKRWTLIDQLAQADYVILSSNRLYRSIPRTPWRYPLTRRYYELLFSGALGFRLERSFTSYPRLGALEIPDDEAEEAFTVYDHPHVLIFKKTSAFDRGAVERLLDAVPLSGIVHVAPRRASALYRQARPTDIPLPRSDGVRTAVAQSEPTSLGALPGGASAVPFGSFREPRGVARAPDGTFYVADFGYQRVQHVDALRRSHGGFGSEGGGPRQFHDPCGVAVGDDGDVYVADTWNHRVQKLSAKGEPIAEWEAGFYGPRGIALDPRGRIYVADTGKHRVVRLSRGGSVEREWGRKGDVLSAPVGIAISAGREVYVADGDRQRVVVFSEDGQLRRQWPIDGRGSGPLREPYLAIGRDGTVWVTDPSSDRVLLFDPRGRPLGTARPLAPLSAPTGIALIDDAHAIVANTGAHSLAVVSRTANTSVDPD